MFYFADTTEHFSMGQLVPANMKILTESHSLFPKDLKLSPSLDRNNPQLTPTISFRPATDGKSKTSMPKAEFIKHIAKFTEVFEATAKENFNNISMTYTTSEATPAGEVEGAAYFIRLKPSMAPLEPKKSAAEVKPHYEGAVGCFDAELVRPVKSGLQHSKWAPGNASKPSSHKTPIEAKKPTTIAKLHYEGDVDRFDAQLTQPTKSSLQNSKSAPGNTFKLSATARSFTASAATKPVARPIEPKLQQPKQAASNTTTAHPSALPTAPEPIFKLPTTTIATQNQPNQPVSPTESPHPPNPRRPLPL